MYGEVCEGRKGIGEMLQIQLMKICVLPTLRGGGEHDQISINEDCCEASFVVMLHDRHKFYTSAEKNIEHYSQLKVVRSKAHRVVRYAASKLAL